MSELEDFFKKKQQEGQNSGSGTSSLEDFFKKKQQEKATSDKNIVTPTENTTSLGDLGNILRAPNNTAIDFSGNSIIKDPVKSFFTGLEEQKKTNELIEKAKMGGNDYISKLNTDEKNILTNGLKMKSLPVDQIPDIDRKLVSEFDATPKENRTALQLSLTTDQINQIGKYRDWRVTYNTDEQKVQQIKSDKEVASIGQGLGPTTISENKNPAGSLDAIKSLTNITSDGMSPSTSVDWNGIFNIAKNPINTATQGVWDINEHINPISENFRKAFEGTDEKGQPLSTTSRVLQGGVGLINSIFMPITYPLQKLGDEQDPENPNYAGNTINKLIALPFTALAGSISMAAEAGGFSKQDAEDIGVILAAVLPFAKGREKGQGKSLITESDKTKETFSKISELDPSVKKFYKESVMEIHPDTSGLPYTYMARFNEASAKGDIGMMKGILEEARIEKKNMKKPEDKSTEKIPEQNPQEVNKQEIVNTVEKSKKNGDVYFERDGELWRKPKDNPPEVAPSILQLPEAKASIIGAGLAGREMKQKVYRDTLKDAGMDDAEIEKTLTIERAFGIDIPKTEFINEFVSRETGKRFTYNTDLTGRYTQDIENAVNTAIENYKKLEGMKSDLGIEKQQLEATQVPSEGEIFYHGSPNPKVIFKGAVDFTKDIETAKHFAEARDRGGLGEGEIATIYKAKLDIKNPKVITTEKEYNDMFQTTGSTEVIDSLTKEGYDALVYKPENGGDTYYKVFSEKQIQQGPEVTSIPEKADNSNIESIKKLSDKEIQEKYTPSEILAIEDKENPTPEETAIHGRYIQAVQAEETAKINKEIESDYAENGQHVAVSEDSDITYRDLEVLAQRIAQTLNDPKIRFGLKRSKNSMDMSTKTEKYLKTSKEGTLEALTEEFQSLKNGLKEIIEYYQRTKKHPYTRQKLGELYEALTKGEYDFLESGDVFQETINPYLYEGKKQVSPKVGKTKSEGARGGSKVSDPDSGTSSEEGGKKVGTSKTGIVNALEKVEEEFTKTENKYPTFAEIDKKTAMEASRGTSFDPEKRGEQRIQGFKVEMEELYDEMIQYAKTDEQIEIVRNEVSDLSQKLAVKQNEINRAESGVVSFMITGPARFPVERMKKKNEAIQRKYEDYTEFKERAKNAIIKKLKGQEVESVGGPIEALKIEIQKLTEYRDLAKRVNAIIKKHKTEEKIYEALIADGVGEKLAKEASTPVRHSGKIETIMLTNLNNKIKDREAKLEKMQKIEAIQGTEEAVKVLYSFDGGKVIDNRGLDRVQIVFDERPNSDTMYDLKKKGWKWSPKNEAWQRFRNSGSVRVARDMFPEVETKKFQSIELSTKILEKLGDRETVSKEFIQNLTNSGEIKQIEKEMIREVMKTEGEKVNVKEFKEKVKMELLPLKVATKKDRLRKDPNAEDYFADPNRYEYVNLPEDLRGSVKDYRENIYESPIEVSAGNVHFRGQTTQYFGHTRVEDMAGTDPYKPDYTKANGVRRVIEVQSDLYQRGRLQQEGRTHREMLKNPMYFEDQEKNFAKPGARQAILDAAQEEVDKLNRLEQYNDPTAHFRMIREEISQASKDGMKVLQFPTGETAMKIEGLGVNNDWFRDGLNLKTDRLEVAAEISQTRDGSRYGSENVWIITEVLGDGKFKAMPKNEMSRLEYDSLKEGKIVNDVTNSIYVEEFDISDKIDKNNPIYKFYEKEVGKYLKNNYEGKIITDDKGVSWYQIDITPDMQNQVLAFQGKDNAWIYDVIGAKYGVKPFAQEKIDIQEVYIEAVKLAPEGWTVRVEDPTEANYLANVSAYADLATKEIVISSTEARKSTAAHEVVHASISELPEDKRKILIDTARKQWQDASNPELSDEQAEEFLAEEFKYYIESQKWKTKTLFGRLKEFLSKLWNTLKGVFGKDNKIKTFYEDILAGNIVNAQTRIGKKFQSVSEDKIPYQYQKKEEEKMPNRIKESLMDFSEEAFVPIDSVIGDISPELKQRLHRFEQQVANSIIMQEGRKILGDIKSKIEKKKDTEEYRIIDLAMKNADKETVDKMAEELGITKDLENMRILLDKVHSDAEKVGIELGFKEEYFPRTINDAKGLINYLHKTEVGSAIMEAIKKAEIKEGRDLTDIEKAAIANNMLRGFTVEGISLSSPGNVKKRMIEKVTQDIYPFYNDSFSSMAIYIQSMNETIEGRKLFGKVFSEEEVKGIRKIKSLKESVQKINDELYPLMEEYDGFNREKKIDQKKEFRKKIVHSENEQEISLYDAEIEKLNDQIKKFDRMQELKDRKKDKTEEAEIYQAFESRMVEFEKQDNINESIGAYTLKLIQEGKISPDQEVRLTKALKARFATPHMHAFIGAYKAVTHITTMGSFFSALSQIQDLGFSIHENGHILTANAYGKALFGKSEIKLSDIGVEPIIFEYADPGKLQQFVDTVFKMVGITLMDRAGKETMINAYYGKLQQQYKKGNVFLDPWMKKFEFSLEEQSKILEDLKNHTVSEDIKYILYCKIMQYQPITKSQMPQYYLTSANGRIAYTLKIYTIKQIDVIRQEALKDINKGRETRNGKLAWKGMKSLMSIAYALMAMGVVSDILKDLLGNRPIVIDDLVIDNMLKLGGMSKYTTYKIKEESLSAGILSVIVPPFNFFNDPLIDYTYFTKKSAKTGGILHPFDITKLQTINNIPVVGKPFYWWFGKGADKSDKKRYGSSTPVLKTTTKKSSSPFSKKGAFSNSKGSFSGKGPFK